MAIQMTRLEYETKYGRKPNVPPKVVAPIVPPEDPNFIQRVSTDIQKRGSNVYDAIAGEGKYAGKNDALGIANRALGATSEAFSAIKDVGFEAIPQTGNTENDIRLRDAATDLGKKVGEKVKGLTDIIASNPKLQDWASSLDKEDWNNIDNLLESYGSAGNISGTILSVNQAAKTAQDVVNKGLDVGSKVVSKTGELIKKTGEKLNASAYSPTANEARLIQNNQIKTKFLEGQLDNATPGTPEYQDIQNQLDDIKAQTPTIRSDTALERGIAGTEKQIGVKSGVEKMKLWKDTIEPALRGSKTSLGPEELFARAEARIANEIDPTRKISLQNALESLKEEFGDTKYNLLDANKLKTALDKFTPPKIFKGQDISSDVKTLKADIADSIRDTTYDSITDTNIKADYRDYANLKQLEDVGIKALTEGGKKGGFGNFWTTIKDQLTVPIKTIGGQTLYRVGNTLEFLGDKGIKTVGDYFNDIGYAFKPIGVDKQLSPEVGISSTNDTTKKWDVVGAEKVSKRTPTEYIDNITESTQKNMQAIIDDPQLAGTKFSVSDAIKVVQKDIVDNMPHLGVSSNAVKQISALNPENFSSIDAFSNAVKSILNKIGK